MVQRILFSERSAHQPYSLLLKRCLLQPPSSLFTFSHFFSSILSKQQPLSVKFPVNFFPLWYIFFKKEQTHFLWTLSQAEKKTEEKNRNNNGLDLIAFSLEVYTHDK